MAIRYARMNEVGLIVPPTKLDCLGEECPTALVTGRCFVDEHHLYFPRAKYLSDPLYDRFAKSIFNKVFLPRCQHNSRYSGAQHTRIDDVPMPKRDVVEAFLDEETRLRRLGVVVRSLADLDLKLTTDCAKFKSYNENRDFERYEQFWEEYAELVIFAKSTELVTQRQIQEPHFLGARYLSHPTDSSQIQLVA